MADLEGVSTRKVKDITEALCGTAFGTSTVSRLVGGLDRDLAAWRERRLEVAYPCLIVDARYERVRTAGRVFNASSLAWARTLKGEVVERWASSHPKLAEWLETALEVGLACFAFPAAHRLRIIRSTNGLERFTEELKRRTRMVQILSNPEAGLRLVTAPPKQSEIRGELHTLPGASAPR